ncbi:MAG: outer membrane beta-barrel protein [Steroidobacteraceae bacterium]
MSSISVMRAASLAALAALCTIPAAHAADNGVYLGASIGRANSRADLAGVTALLREFDKDDTGFKAFVGVRPIDLVAAEITYVDFGSPSQAIAAGSARGEIRGAAAFGVVYLPLPLPLDLYGKAGFARLDTKVTAGSFRLDRSGTDFAWGVGAQFSLGSLAIRAEYERYRTDVGQPDLLSVGLSWTFL